MADADSVGDAGSHVMSRNDSLNDSLSHDGMWNESDVVEYAGMDSHHAEAVHVIYYIIIPTICACGILGILLTVVVLSRKNMATSTNCYMMALAITDMLFLILLASKIAERHFVPHSNSFYIFQIYGTYAIIFMNIFLMMSIWLTVLLALERYIAICRPFLAARMCTVTKARIFIVVILIFVFLCRLPNFWEHKVHTMYDRTTNTSTSFVEQTAFSYNKNYMAVYPWLIEGVFTSIIPFVLLLILNARLIWEVRKSTQYIQRNLVVARTASAVQREEIQITIMLISIVIVFFLCQAPYVIYTAIVNITDFAAPSSGFMLFRYITMLLLTLKSAINFIIYCWFSEKFWATLKRIFCLQKCMVAGKQSQNGSYYNLRRYSNCTRDTTI